MLKDLLRGVTAEAENRLKSLWQSIGNNPSIAWYPSAGNDYRDLLELHADRIEQLGILQKPDLFIHTDCNPPWLNFEGEVFVDTRTKVVIDQKYPLHFTKDFQYIVSDLFVDFPENAPKKPTIWLLDVVITSLKYGVIRRPVLYFLLENINFLDEIVLLNKISVKFLIKIREGCGWGGSRKSIALSYAFLSALGTEYLIIDQEQHTDLQLVNAIKERHKLVLSNYHLKRLSRVSNWSGFNVNIFKTEFINEALTDNQFLELLEIISPPGLNRY